jgi:hypothetical protein
MFRIWNGLSFLGIAFLYFPKSQTRVQGEAAKAILKEIDYVGGFFSIVGLTLLYANSLRKQSAFADYILASLQCKQVATLIHGPVPMCWPR